LGVELKDMANINDYKLLRVKCERYYQELSKQTGTEVKSDNDKSRLGFYFFILDNLFGLAEADELIKHVTDTDFNTKLGEDRNDDCGIDAVYIDYEQNIINLLNFKYRDNFKLDSKQKLNDVINSTKYINAIYAGDIEDLEGKPKEFALKIKGLYDSKEVWKTNLYIVSNDTSPVDVNDKHIRNVVKGYDIEVNPISLSEITDLMSIRPEPINATLILPNDALMSYAENDLSTSRSYIARLKSSDVVRITCNNAKLRDQYDLEHYGELEDVQLDFSVLFDNVRGFVQKSKYNTNIYKSLEDNPSKFFMYNNGITIVAKDIKAIPVNGQSQMKITINNFQVLNGGQTVRTIHNFNEDNERNIIDYLSKSEVLVRMFMIDEEEGEVNKIAEYTNSQNTISAPDLRSLNQKQIELENYLREKKVNYVRKSGDIGKEDLDYEYTISMVRFGQLLFALSGNPEKSTSSKKSIFGKKYDEVFSDASNYLENSYSIIKNYHDIKAAYSRLGYESIDIKHYYILYLNDLYPKISTDKKIEILEKQIIDFKVEKETTAVRKMSKVPFKEALIEVLKKETV
jgi:hypothetical protein